MTCGVKSPDCMRPDAADTQPSSGLVPDVPGVIHSVDTVQYGGDNEEYGGNEGQGGVGLAVKSSTRAVRPTNLNQ